MTMDFSKHPCFNDAVRHQYGRIHLPVAPDCNIQCNFCDRRFNCVNESRPGVTTSVLTPHQALGYLEQSLVRDPRITVVGIAGPGDPFANVDATLQTLRMVRGRYPEMLLCVATNGLNVALYADELARLRVSHVTLTVNAVEPRIGQHVYAWVRDGRDVYRGEAAARLLWERQQDAIRRLKARDLVVKINTILIPGINDRHVDEVARTMRDLGADILNCVPMYPVADTPLAEVPEPSPQMVAEARRQVALLQPLVADCDRHAELAAAIEQQRAAREALQAYFAGLKADPERRATNAVYGATRAVSTGRRAMTVKLVPRMARQRTRNLASGRRQSSASLTSVPTWAPEMLRSRT